MCLGLREQPEGTLYYENLPDFDQSYATLGLPGAVEPRQFAGAPSLTFVFTEFNQTGRSANEDLVVKRTGNVNMTALTCVFPGGGAGSADGHWREVFADWGFINSGFNSRGLFGGLGHGYDDHGPDARSRECRPSR